MLRIQSTHELAAQLNVSEELLLKLAISMRKHVRPFQQPKPDGGYRQFYAPSEKLKEIQRTINKRLLQPIPLPKEFHGGVPGRSTVTNATPHIRKALVAKVDIKDFYPSIHPRRVYKLFLSLGCSSDVSRVLTQLTTYEFQLAQGFPTSTAIANLILAGFWPRIKGACKVNGITITDFIDDLALSGDTRVRRTLGLIRRIFKEEGFKLNPLKTKLMSRDEEQIVTGHSVNNRVNPPKGKVREVKVLLQRWDTNGIDSVIADKSVTEFIHHVQGRIAYIMQGNRNKGIHLLYKFRKLRDRDTNNKF